jgi:type II secretory pathway component PulC
VAVGRERRAAVAVLAGAVAGLGLLNWHLARMPIDISPIAPEADRAAAPRKDGFDLATKLDRTPAAQFTETVSRPLFNPSRRPVQRDQARTDDAGAAPGDMRLAGVMTSPNQPARALIRMANEATGTWITEGEDFNGWRLREVNARSVVVESQGRSRELTLSTSRRPREDAAAPDPAGKSR